MSFYLAFGHLSMNYSSGQSLHSTVRLFLLSSDHLPGEMDPDDVNFPWSMYIQLQTWNPFTVVQLLLKQVFKVYLEIL